MKTANVTGLATAAVYVTDFKEALHFYESVLGFKKFKDMGSDGCWGEIGDLGLYIGGGATPVKVTVGDQQVTLVLAVDDIGMFHSQAKSEGIAIDEELMPSGDGKSFWFRFKDPSGNLLEAAGEVRRNV